MSEIKPTNQHPKPILSAANLGLLTGLAAACCLGFYCHSESPQSPAVVSGSHPQPIPSTAAKCKELDLELVNSESCRPKEPIDFFIIEDYSKSAIDQGFNDEYRNIAKSVERYFRSPGDHISCLGFANSVSPPTLAPHPNYQFGCSEKRRTTSLIKKRNSTNFYSTNFTELFKAVGKALIEERDLQNQLDSSKPNNRPPEIEPKTYHRDLVIIITDGIHDPNNKPPDCTKEGLEPLPKDVQRAVQSLGERLSMQSDEVWLFLILAPTDDCATRVLKQWEGLQRFGLNVLRADAYSHPDAIARTIFERIIYRSFTIEPVESFSAEKQRRQLDKLGWFEMRFRLKRKFLRPEFAFPRSGFEPGPIVGSQIPIKRAFLEESSRRDTSTPADQKSALHISKQTHHLFLGDHSSLPQQGSTLEIDTSEDYTNITFTPYKSNHSIKPKHDYQLKLEFEGNVSSQLVTFPHLWTTRFLSDLHSWQKNLSGVVVTVYILLGILFLACTRQVPGGSPEQARELFASRFKWPRSTARFLTTNLIAISVATLATQAWFNLELTPSLPMAVSLVSALCLQPKTNILIEVLALIAISLKIAPSTST